MEKRTFSLTPLADLFNHKSPKTAEWGYSDKINAFYSKAIVDIKQGEEVNFINLDILYLR